MQRFGRKHVNESQKLLRLARKLFPTTFPLIWNRATKKRLVPVRSELLDQFLNTLTADYQYTP